MPTIVGTRSMSTSTLFTIITNLLYFVMTVVGLNYGFTGQNES
jgi:hypothetical protein